MRGLKILSIDWDYFFPDSFPYDWGHREVVFFLEGIWPIRLTNHNTITGEEAFSEYTPTIPRNFWKRVVKGEPLIYVAESHASILAIPFQSAIVTNLDAHHDCGYGHSTSLECGNWAHIAGSRIKEFHQVYPSWRKIGSEGPPQRKPDSIINGLPELDYYDLVFVCRSGCWTPPWYDNKFQAFLRQSGNEPQFMDQFAGKNRSPSMAKAKVLKLQMDEQFKLLRHGKVA